MLGRAQVPQQYSRWGLGPAYTLAQTRGDCRRVCTKQLYRHSSKALRHSAPDDGVDWTIACEIVHISRGTINGPKHEAE
jgi:hypothetical protein